MIVEFANIIVLWEEQWLSTFPVIQTNIMRFIVMQKQEVSRVVENVTHTHNYFLCNHG